MRRRIAIAAVFLSVLAVKCAADTYAPPPDPGTLAALVAPLVPNDYAGTSTVSTLPTPSTVVGKRFYVTDLGGGPGPVYSLGTCYKRVVQTVAPTVVQASATIAVTNLVQTLLFQLTAPPSLLPNITVTATGLCPGDIFTIYIPNGVLTTAGTIGVSLNAAPAITLTALTSAYSADFLWTGTAALKIRGAYVQ